VIWTLDLVFEAPDRPAALQVRSGIMAVLLAASLGPEPWETIVVGEIAERMPLVTFQEEEDEP
jgi:hypothetical protein